MTSINLQPAGANTDNNAENDKAVVGAELRYYGLSAALVVAGVLGGLWFQHENHPDLSKLPQLATGVSVFAVLYIFAQVIERLLEPISPWLGGALGVHEVGPSNASKNILLNKRDTAVVQFRQAQVESTDGAGGIADAEADADVAAAQRSLNQFRANASTLSIGLAACLAMIGCGYMGALMLHLIGLTGVAAWVDVLVTGLAVGGGTKPLHDLITNIKESKESKQDSKVAGA